MVIADMRIVRGTRVTPPELIAGKMRNHDI
jgi:hypothetical protein